MSFEVGYQEFGLVLLSLRCLDIQMKRLSSHMDINVLSSGNKNNKEKHNSCYMPDLGLNTLYSSTHLMS